VPGVVVERFAQVVGEAVYADGVFQNHQHLGSAVGTAAYSEANGNYSISGLDAGYYLVKDREGSENGTTGFHTEYILQVVQSVTVQVKGDTVSVTKKVSDALDGEFGKMVSAGSTDRIYYQWTGTLPENLASYTTYAYRFTDTLPQGIAFNRFESICILDEDGDVVKFCKEDMTPARYRSMPDFEHNMVLQATFRGTTGDTAAIEAAMEDSRTRRKNTQPLQASAGCTFRNPEEIPAGKLIEELGLKGFSIGGAQVSTKHGNFIINTGNAKATDVTELIDHIIRTAQKERGITLHEEVQVIGAREIEF
jgi:fimbrial isopeptide formation D2 family protein